VTDIDGHCGNDCGGWYDPDSGDHEPSVDCVCCECCCSCLGCEYGPRDGMLMNPEQIGPVS